MSHVFVRYQTDQELFALRSMSLISMDQIHHNSYDETTNYRTDVMYHDGIP